MRNLTPLVAVVLMMLLSACGGDGGETATPFAATISASPTPPPGCSPVRTATPGDQRRTIDVGGVGRTYLLHVPATYDGTTRIPVVVAFHGFSLTGDFLAGYTLFGEQADEQGFVVAFPDALGEPPRWNSGEAVDQADDVGFATALLDTLEQDLCINPEGVFLAGYSNGGGMAQRLACLQPKRIAAIGTVAATYVGCEAPVPWVAFHGIADPLVPFDGGENPPERGGGTFPPVRRVLSDWSRELGCDALGQISRPKTGVELTTFVHCTLGDGEVLLYALIGGGHTWPGAYDLPAETVGPTSKQIDATATMWEFFARYTTGVTEPVNDVDEPAD